MPHLIRRLQSGLLALLTLLGALAVLALLIHVSADVAMRSLRGTPIPATYEIVTHYYMVGLAFLPLAWVETRGGMVRIDVIHGLMPAGVRRVSDLGVTLISALVYGALAWVTLRTALTNTANGSFIMTNNVRVVTWPAFWLPPLGLGIAALVTALRALWPEETPA
ncbi:TRAP transporter small permease [Paracoccus aestuarii]|uniref:TRAP transporter small permease protein n=1 Tax=Paracoccus aestuarii TaxID=453842 RepID=A0A418ZU04_9RHOB|nr:TRAP transporter small permease [Paracoccus aestuarii]RJL01153.1 TRAP transporter small permease [Paracoccus aestuarii]WCR01106.1 TRAP transporter small permease [Paracoccus aestuarii]